LAAQFSDDPGSKEQGGDLGYFGKGAMVLEFEEQVFTLNVGDISEPVRTQFGLHIIEVMDIRAADVKSLDEVRDQLVAEEKHRRGLDLMYDELDNLANLAFEYSDSLKKVAEEFGLQIQETEWFTKQGGAGITSNQGVINAAFSEDVLLDKNNSEPVELTNDRMVVVRVKEYREPAVQSLEAVHDEILQFLVKEQAQQLARDQGIAALQRLNEGVSMEQLADELEVSLDTAGFIRRNTQTVDPVVISKAFQLPAPEENGSSYGDLALESGHYALLRVSAVRDGDPGTLSEEQAAVMARQYMQLRNYYERNALADRLKAAANITVGNWGP